MIVLGIDPGTAVMGYGVVAEESDAALRGAGFNASASMRRGTNANAPRSHHLVECGVIRTTPRDPLPVRLAELFDGVTDLIARHRPDALAVEDVFYARNVRTTISLGHARGVILLAGQRAGLAIHEYPPAEIKKAIAGTGIATKQQIQFMVTRLLRLTSAPSPADAADGVAAALTCLMTSRIGALHALAQR